MTAQPNPITMAATLAIPTSLALKFLASATASWIAWTVLVRRRSAPVVVPGRGGEDNGEESAKVEVRDSGAQSADAAKTGTRGEPLKALNEGSGEPPQKSSARSDKEPSIDGDEKKAAAWRCACEGGFLPPGLLKSFGGAQAVLKLGIGQCYHNV